jgi:hypothetical protein
MTKAGGGPAPPPTVHRLRRRARGVRWLRAGLSIDEGALSFVTFIRFSIWILHINENFGGIMTKFPRLSRPPRGC